MTAIGSLAIIGAGTPLAKHIFHGQDALLWSDPECRAIDVENWLLVDRDERRLGDNTYLGGNRFTKTVGLDEKHFTGLDYAIFLDPDEGVIRQYVPLAIRSGVKKVFVCAGVLHGEMAPLDHNGDLKLRMWRQSSDVYIIEPHETERETAAAVLKAVKRLAH